MKLTHKIKSYYKRAYQMGHYPSLSSVLFSGKKVFVYYGFLGDNNYGDELVYEATKELFKDHILLPLRRQMPIELRLFLNYRKHKIAGIVIGGGTLVGPFWEPDFFKSLVEMGKRVFLHGTGVHKKIDAQEPWKFILNKEIFGGVRGPMSVKNVSVVKDKMNIAGDAAFALFSDQSFIKRSENKNVLINLGTHDDYEGQAFFRKEFNDFIRFLIQDGYHVQYLPFHEVDVELGKVLKNTFPEITVIKQPVGFDECARIFADCTFALGERLHFTVMAIMTRSPFLSLNYAKKHEDLLLSLSIPEAGSHPSETSKDKMTDAFTKRNDFDWAVPRDKMVGYKDFQFKETAEFIAKS